MVDLSMRVKDGNVRSIVFKSGVNGFHSGNPDFSLMRKQVKAAIGESRAPRRRRSLVPRSRAKSVNDACAYDPKIAETARPTADCLCV